MAAEEVVLVVGQLSLFRRAHVGLGREHLLANYVVEQELTDMHPHVGMNGDRSEASRGVMGSPSCRYSAPRADLVGGHFPRNSRQS